MIAFVTLFLGIALGPQQVELLAAPNVARAEILLDGSRLATVDGPPWKVGCDLGVELSPHQLTAVAYGEDGTELGRTSQWINLPSPPVGVDLMVEHGTRDAPAVVRLSWDSVETERPESVRATFDGRELQVRDPHAIPLPAHDPKQLHFLHVELHFPSGAVSVVERTLGGTYVDELDADLTGIPVELDKGRRLPALAGLQGWLTSDGRPLEVVGVDRGPADVLVVRDETARADLALLARRPGLQRRSLALVGRLKKDQWVRLLTPFARQVPHESYRLRLFEPSQPVAGNAAGIFWVLTHGGQSRRELADQQLADAVAVAGMTASAGARRRAVILVVGEGRPDTSQLSIQQVRGYLAALRVPLLVWTTRDSPGAEIWGSTRSIRSLDDLEAATVRLRKQLDRQRILWVEGVHLPQRVRLSPAAAGVSLSM